MAAVSPDPAEVMKDCRATPGTDDYHDMPDGWRLHSETFMPDGAATHMIVHSHGWMESTVTIGVRRLAKQCASRGIVLVTYDMHGHGLSLEKNGVKLCVRAASELHHWPAAASACSSSSIRAQIRAVNLFIPMRVVCVRPESKRGKIEGCQEPIAVHVVEMAKLMLAKHKLPLIITGHSMGATGTFFATRRVVEACKAAGVPYVCGLYLAPQLQLTPAVRVRPAQLRCQLRRKLEANGALPALSVCRVSAACLPNPPVLLQLGLCVLPRDVLLRLLRLLHNGDESSRDGQKPGLHTDRRRQGGRPEHHESRLL
eukprot:SAG22_NODE_3661_length_1587_cov_1.270833_2_plen_313_part_00